LNKNCFASDSKPDAAPASASNQRLVEVRENRPDGPLYCGILTEKIAD